MSACVWLLEVIEQMSGKTLRGDVYTEGRLKPVTLIFTGFTVCACVCVCVHVQCEDIKCG